ncbi:hypothetical protein CORC01_05464 [Colletotrichum orchidophilum]|uniref:Uncharacterized protein n=1 Tax=Colletotrichum orchidophilum TaxID=1209926 RepID=A0A1G4BCR0_9PEZI|nr:uncharacterized protein CORC01_05464 [Colletotrichum orchidophilum]OHE99183.1 hypothetical protein CORC01_05464 [Colletotrichum orchidophilum]
MSSRRDRTAQGSRAQAANLDTAGDLQDHSPHRLSIIEEASRQSSRESSRDADGTNMYDEQGFLEEDPPEIYGLNEFELMNSNVGPHGPGYGALTQETADTVLYGNWEQDNNLRDLNRSSSPDTVVQWDENTMQYSANVWEHGNSTDSESYSRSVHEGPELQDASIKIEGIPTTKDWSIFKSNLVDYGPDEPSPRLPGCSAGHPYAKTWKMSDSMMMAYDALRGSMMQANDPLRSWMEVKAFEAALRAKRDDAKVAGTACQHEEESKGKGKSVDTNSFSHSQPQKTSKMQSSPVKRAATAGLSADQKRDMDAYIQMLKEANMAAAEYPPADVERKTAYDIPRPRYLHVAPKFEEYRFENYLHPTAEVSQSSYKHPYDPDRDFAKEYDISDDEGDPASGRISPCTFRLLAEGCAEQNPRANQVFMAEDAQRMRPATPLGDGPEKNPPDRLTLAFEVQRDINDQGWMTPCYSVDSEPSIIYLPPGVTLKHKMRNWWFGLFDRMNPIVARRFHKVEFREDGDPIAPLETITELSAPSTDPAKLGRAYAHHYTEAEISEVLNTPGARHVAGIPAKTAEVIITQRWQTVLRWRTRDGNLTRQNDVMRVAIERARIELREMRMTVDHLLEKKAAEELAQRQKHHRRVLRRVSAHLHELRYEVQSRFQSLKNAEDQNQNMRAELAEIQYQIKGECSRASMSGPNEVRRAVSQNFRDKMAALELSDCF